MLQRLAAKDDLERRSRMWEALDISLFEAERSVQISARGPGDLHRDLGDVHGGDASSTLEQELARQLPRAAADVQHRCADEDSVGGRERIVVIGARVRVVLLG